MKTLENISVSTNTTVRETQNSTENMKKHVKLIISNFV